MAGEINAALKRTIEGLKKPFATFASDFSDLSEKRAELAPRLMTAYGSFLQQTGGNFVEFARLLDPRIPADRTAYRAHKSFQAADYLRRLVARRDVGRNRAKPVRSNLTALARTLATVMRFARDPEAVWTAIGGEFGLTARQLARLRQVTGEVKPLLDIKATPQAVKVVHVETEAELTAASTKGRKLSKVA